MLENLIWTNSICCWILHWALISHQFSELQPKFSLVTQTQARNPDLRPDKSQGCCQRPSPSQTEPGAGRLQSRQRTNKLLSISMVSKPLPMSCHWTHTIILGGSYFVGQHAASHIKSEHQPQETLLSVCNVISTTPSVPEMCQWAVLLDQDAWQNDKASFLSFKADRIWGAPLNSFCTY